MDDGKEKAVVDTVDETESFRVIDILDAKFLYR